MKAITINNIDYEIKAMDTFTQFHVTRKLAPVFVKVAELSEKGFDDLKLSDLQPTMEFLAGMSEEDVNYVLKKSLACVFRADVSGKMARVMNGETLMFRDIDMMVMLQLTVDVIMVNLGNFSNALPIRDSSQG